MKVHSVYWRAQIFPSSEISPEKESVSFWIGAFLDKTTISVAERNKFSSSDFSTSLRVFIMSLSSSLFASTSYMSLHLHNLSFRVRVLPRPGPELCGFMY